MQHQRFTGVACSISAGATRVPADSEPTTIPVEDLKVPEASAGRNPKEEHCDCNHSLIELLVEPCVANTTSPTPLQRCSRWSSAHSRNAKHTHTHTRLAQPSTSPPRLDQDVHREIHVPLARALGRERRRPASVTVFEKCGRDRGNGSGMEARSMNSSTPELPTVRRTQSGHLGQHR